MGPRHAKTCPMHIQTAKAKIRLRICAVWSGRSLFGNRFIGHYRKYEWRAKTRMRLCAHAQDDLTLQILRMFEGTFSLDMARIIWKPWEKNHLCKSKTVEHLAFTSQIQQTTSWRCFSYVWQKIGIDISRKLSPEQTISMKCHILFSVAKLKKNVIEMSSAEHFRQYAKR